MPEEPRPPTASATVVNNGLGWLAPVANFTAVGILGVFLFWHSNALNTRLDKIQENNNDFHREIYQSMGAQAARDALLVDVQHRLDEANKKLDRVEFRLAFQSGGLSALFTEPKEKR